MRTGQRDNRGEQSGESAIWTRSWEKSWQKVWCQEKRRLLTSTAAALTFSSVEPSPPCNRVPGCLFLALPDAVLTSTSQLVCLVCQRLNSWYGEVIYIRDSPPSHLHYNLTYIHNHILISKSFPAAPRWALLYCLPKVPYSHISPLPQTHSHSHWLHHQHEH